MTCRYDAVIYTARFVSRYLVQCQCDLETFAGSKDTSTYLPVLSRKKSTVARLDIAALRSLSHSQLILRSIKFARDYCSSIEILRWREGDGTSCPGQLCTNPKTYGIGPTEDTEVKPTSCLSSVIRRSQSLIIDVGRVVCDEMQVHTDAESAVSKPCPRSPG